MLPPRGAASIRGRLRFKWLFGAAIALNFIALLRLPRRHRLLISAGPSSKGVSIFLNDLVAPTRFARMMPLQMRRVITLLSPRLGLLMA